MDAEELEYDEACGEAGAERQSTILYAAPKTNAAYLNQARFKYHRFGTYAGCFLWCLDNNEAFTPIAFATEQQADFPQGTALMGNGLAIGGNGTARAAFPLIVAGTAAPTTGTWKQGARVINRTPTELGSGGAKYMIDGWACTVGGTPGTWLEQRTLTGN